MRRASFGALTVIFSLACISAFAQNNTPQWKVVKTIRLTQQSNPIPTTTLFTPTKTGAYRITAYISTVGPTQALGWDFSFSWTDMSDASERLVASVAPCGGCPSQVATIAPTPFSPQAETPVQFGVGESTPPPVDSTYSLWFTIEQLE